MASLLAAPATGGQDAACHNRLDPVEVLIGSYPVAARIPNRQGLLPLHIALSKGKRTWRTGVSAMVQAAPEVLLTRDNETNLLPFQLAAAMDDRDAHSSTDQDTTESAETVVELLLACPHAMTCSQ